MNLEFLGDALDHWKGSLFESLKRSDILRDFAVDPMAIDWRSWQPESVLAFTRLLRIDESQLILHKAEIANRERYFGEITHFGDLFLDPDTGVATGKVKEASQYVRPKEIKGLLGNADRLVVVYQHVRAMSVAKRVDDVCLAIRKEVTGLHWCSYESSTVAMIFLSLSAARISAVAECFRAFLGSASARRIRTC